MTTLTNEGRALEVLAQFSRVDSYAVDTETTGLKPQETDRIVGVGLYQPELGGFYFPFRHHSGDLPMFPSDDTNLSLSVLHAFQGLFSDGGISVMHNAQFDVQAFRADGVEVGRPIVDTLFTAWLKDDGLTSYALDALVSVLLPEDKHLVEQKLAMKAQKVYDMGKLPIDQVAPYCIGDCRMTWDLLGLHRPWIAENRELWEREMRWVSVLADLSWQGVPWDREEAARQIDRLHQYMQGLSRMLMPLAGDFNPGSPQQMYSWLRRAYGLELESQRTKYGGEDLVDMLLRPDVYRLPGVDWVIAYRQAHKALTSWYEPYQEYGKNGRVHCSFGLPTGTGPLAETGRLRASRPNLTGIVNDDGGIHQVRSCIRSEHDWIVTGDYPQAELRVAAEITGDKALKEALATSNPHKHVAQELGIPYDAAKRTNFGSLYGIRPKRLMIEVNKHYNRTHTPMQMTYAEADRYLSLHHMTYKDIQRAHRRLARDWYAGGQRSEYRLWTGRIHHFGISAEAHALLDIVVQSSVAEIIKEAALWIDTLLETQKLKTRMILLVHDELIFEIPDQEVRDGIPWILCDLMAQATGECCPTVGFTVRPKIGRSWAEADRDTR